MIKQALLQQLIAARENNQRIDEVHPSEKPASLDEAYATADALAKAINRAVIGWKIGASIPRAWTRLGLSEPFGGRIFEGTAYTSPAVLDDVPGVLTLGAEFAFQLGTDIHNTKPEFSAQSILRVIDAVYPVIELNYPYFSYPMEIGGLCLIADNGVNYGLVRGEPIADWPTQKLSQTQVSVAVNDHIKSIGTAAEIEFDPYAALAWFVNDRIKRGDTLKTGLLISSGDLVGPVEVGPGAQVVAEFGALGRVSVRL